jgi:hypothetical protein
VAVVPPGAGEGQVEVVEVDRLVALTVDTIQREVGHGGRGMAGDPRSVGHGDGARRSSQGLAEVSRRGVDPGQFAQGVDQPHRRSG